MTGNELAHLGDTIIMATCLMVVAIFIVSGLDDLFIDLNAFFRRIRPQKVSARGVDEWRAIAPRKFAIVVPAWDESSVIGRMLTGNIARIDYPADCFAFYVGVYPNDQASIDAVERVTAVYPNVRAVISPLPGPTSKGQILNHVARSLIDGTGGCGQAWDAILLHDAEDLIDPLSLWLMNERLEGNHYVQIPVFSLPLAWNQLVAGTYIDEFAESHTKDVLVRASLGAPLPSAGVGTAVRRDLVEYLLARGDLLNEKSLTEDYELGIRVGLAGFRQDFAARYVVNDDGQRSYIATREFFPKGFYRSIRQKTRWTIGITMQGWRNLSWPGNLRDRYFFFRDRKGLVTNPATILGYLTIPVAMQSSSVHWMVATAVSILAVNRITQRSICVLQVYGPATAMMCLPRWPVACIINAAATVRAIKQHLESRWSGKAVRWVKTEHDLPEGFGVHN